MSIAVLIPARYASTRFPGKPLARLNCPDGRRRPLIQLTWEAATRVAGVDEIHVLTDDARIRDAAESFGASVFMTSANCQNGTERCAEIVRQLDAEIIVNIQGDAPLTPPWFVEALINEMRHDPFAQVTTPILRLDVEGYEHFAEDRRNGRVGGTTAVFDDSSDALYFSKEIIPWLGADTDPAHPPVWHHVGVYAYRRNALEAYCDAPRGRLETIEGLEQLRFLEQGQSIRCVEVQAHGHPFWELNNPEDVTRIEAALRKIS